VSRPIGGFVIAVDGPAASGKGTIATWLGEHYRLPVLDTGLLYRAVGVMVLREGKDLDDEAAAADVARRLDVRGLDDLDFRALGSGEAASRVAAHPAVREALLALQRAFAAQPGGAVIDGRDIGTVIAPGAPAKLYVTASAEERARRRWRQLTAAGDGPSFEDVLDDIERRDDRDAGRADAPMKPADDAVLLDTTEMSISAAADAARRIVEAARARWETAQGKSNRASPSAAAGTN
jgi:cytidylate kinase